MVHNTQITNYSSLKTHLHEHQVPNPDPNLDHNPHGRGGLSMDSNPVCLRVNATNLDQDPNSLGPALAQISENFGL